MNLVSFTPEEVIYLRQLGNMSTDTVSVRRDLFAKLMTLFENHSEMVYHETHFPQREEPSANPVIHRELTLELPGDSNARRHRIQLVQAEANLLQAYAAFLKMEEQRKIKLEFDGEGR